MAADQERADRIRQVRQDKHLRWKQIANYVGVEMRSAQMWQETGAISWENARKFAELASVDPHWLMSGAETSTPDPFESEDGSVQARLAALTQEVAGDRQDREANIAEVKKLIAEQAAALREQAGVLADLTAAVKDLRETVAALTPAADRISEVTQRADETSQRAAEIVQGIAARVEAGDLQAPARSSRATASKTQPKRTPAA